MKMCAEIMDVTRDEAKRILRRLELEAYSSIISAFRAQGDLSRSKKKLLQELGTQLSISTERHRAEVRRAYSDDRLAVVAESIYGPGSCAEWAAEGRRLVPLMPRLVPQTVFSASATAAANTAAAANAKVLSSSGNKAAASSSASNSTVNSSNVSSNGPSSVNHQTIAKATNSKPQPQTGGMQANDADGFDDDGKPKRRRRLSVTSLNKPVTKVTIPTPLVTKPLTKTTSVSTMTKAGKALGPVGTVKTVPRISPLSASASQVKLLTKTVAVTQTVCQAKTVLSYKTLTSVASSPVKVQTVMTQSTPKTQTKVTTATPPKALLTSKTPSSTAVKNVTVPSGNPVVTTSPIPVTLKTTTLTAAQLAGRQRAKQVTTRFKPLPGTVKFKTVTPATMGTGSTVTMVTPSPSTQASSVSGTQPVVRVIHVPGTGGVGGSKPVVVMTTGLSKSAVGGVVPGITSGTSLSKATSQVAPSSSAGKAPVTTATTTVQSTKPSTTLAHAVSSAPKTVVMTTLVGSKRVVLSVPAPLPVSSISNPTSSSQGLGITKSQGLPSLASSNASQLHAPSKKEIKPSPLTTVCLTPSPSQPTPSHSASTVTTQVRSRPLPALLPAPPKPSIITPSQTTVTPTTTASVRKLPTILPAPAKNMAVIPTVLVPVAAGVGATAAGQLQPSIPLVVAPALTAVGVPGVCPDGGGEQCPPFTVAASQDCNKISMDLGSLHCEETLVTETPVLDSHAPSEREHKEQSVVESPELSNQTNSKLASQYEQSTVTEGDNNTSSEDDSLLMCSETIDSGCGLADTSSSLEYYQGVSESTPIKSSVSQIEQDLAEMPPSVLGISDQQTELTPCDTSVPLIDIEVPVSDLQTLEIQKEKANEQEHSPTTAAVEPLENVTVERLGDPGVISDVVESSIPDQFASDSLDLTEQVKVCDAELDSALHSAGVNIVHKEDEEQQTVKDESQGLPHPMENALQVIASFVESMEGGPLAKDEQKQTTDILSHEPPSKFQRMESYSSENSDFAKELLDITCEQSNIPHNVNSAANPDSIQDTESSSNALLTCHEENWDVTSDANIDILSTSTSSCGSTPDCLDLTEKEIKALESAASIRTSGRKRKPPSSLEVSPSRQVSGWVRGALSLLQRVGSYRGQGRRKSDYGAATWFLKPVDPVDAPGYYKVIKTPMDFGTIKVKLETGQYQEYSEFHSDMLLVKTNCLKYNPPGHDVRQDCNEVFAFYENEYTKMLERWEKCHVSPAKKPRIAAKVESTT